MKIDFSVLSQFLDSLGPEVSGRSSTSLTAKEAKAIRQFAEGKLDAGQRAALLPNILENEKALHELVQALAARK
ncbi:MAG: hypothetical protein WD342_21180 [Verrucomicrobiales bacterium]